MSVESIGAVGVEPAAPVKPIVGGEPLWSYLESIIDKKVNKVSLNIFEKLVDFLSYYLYSSYNKRYEFKASQVDLNNPVELKKEEPSDLSSDAKESPPLPPATSAVNAIAGEVLVVGEQIGETEVPNVNQSIAPNIDDSSKIIDNKE